MSRDWTDADEENRREAIIERRRENEPELPANPPPGPKWQALTGLGRLNLNGAQHAVMLCLVDRANQRTGLCYPSEEFISGWTGRQLRVVERAIETLKDRGLLIVKKRFNAKTRTVSNRYYIAWPLLFTAFIEIKIFEAENTRQKCRLATRATRQKYRLTTRQRCRVNLRIGNLRIKNLCP
jgi:hypothetical protein